VSGIDCTNKEIILMMLLRIRKNLQLQKKIRAKQMN